MLLANGMHVGYRALVVCPGLHLDWDKIDGLRDALGRNGVCSNYSAEHAEYTWRCIQDLDGGDALFTQPAMPIKCAGAPQKIMYLAADHLRRQGKLDRTRLGFFLPGEAIFGVPFFVPPLLDTVRRYGITVNYKHTLKAVDGPARKAIFTATGPDGATSEVVRSFTMLHATPAAGRAPPSSAKARSRTRRDGWRWIRPTLQHPRYPNVFSLGDAAGTTNAKTAAAVRLQAPVVVRRVGRGPERWRGHRHLRRLRLLPAHHRLRRGGAGRVHLRRQGGTQLPARPASAAPQRLAAEDQVPAAPVLALDAARQ